MLIFSHLSQTQLPLFLVTSSQFLGWKAKEVGVTGMLASCELELAVTGTQQFMAFSTQVNTAAPFDLALPFMPNTIEFIHFVFGALQPGCQRLVRFTWQKINLWWVCSLRWSLSVCCATPISRIWDKMDLPLSESGNCYVELKIMMQFSSSF